MLDDQKVFKLLAEVTAKLEAGNYKYWLDAGTLLGVVRNGGLIGHDNDIDLGIPANVYQQKDKLKKLMWDPGWTCQLTRTSQLRFRHKTLAYFDFWGFDPVPNAPYYYHQGWGGYFYFKKEYVDTLSTITCRDVTFFVPSNPIEFLVNLYGPDWETPKTMKRRRENQDPKDPSKLTIDPAIRNQVFVKPDDYVNFSKACLTGQAAMDYLAARRRQFKIE